MSGSGEQCVNGVRMIKKTKEIKEMLMNQYGRGEEKDEKKTLLWVVLFLLILWLFVIIKLPKVIQYYFGCVEISMLITFISRYFFRKKKNTHKFRKQKIICYFSSLSVSLIIFLPMIFIGMIINFIADITNKKYVIKRNPNCAIVELLYHFCLAVILVQQTILKSDKLIELFVTYTVFLVADRVFCFVVRRVFITGKNGYYERYRYRQEMDVASEYIFLGVTTISIIFSATNMAYVFMPLLLWYSLKQIRKLWIEKKSQNVINAFLLEILKQLQELQCIYLESILVEEISVIEYMEDVKRVRFYREYNNKRNFYYFRSRKHAEMALEMIEKLSLKKYMIPKDKEVANADIEAVMNSIVRCMVLFG